MTAEQDIAAIDDSGANTAAEVRTALTSVLGRADLGGVLVLPLHSPDGVRNNGQWANMPAGPAFFMHNIGSGNGARHIVNIDLSTFTEVRLTAWKDGILGNAGSTLDLRYRTTFSTDASLYSDIGTSPVSLAIDVVDQMLVTSWIDIAAGAQADVFIALVGEGGNSVQDPIFGAITAQFR